MYPKIAGEMKSAIAKLPDRYWIRTKGEERELVCRESPTMAVRIDRGKTISASAARKSPPGSIYLDGAAEGGPFLDMDKAIFNLDHHEGCVRSFTLATCEQAMMLIRKGLDLQKRDWTIHANDPDLDTVLAIWVLLNHMRLSDADIDIRRKVTPLVRLEGTIDAHGLETLDICAFPVELQESVLADLKRLRSREVDLKRDNKWQEIDFLEYTAELLRSIDAVIYSSHHFEGLLEVEELARVEIGGGELAIVCRSEAGVYELERHLRQLHGRRLGVIILQKDSRTYTLRQVDAFLPMTLDGAYHRLNLIDPAASHRASGNRWGGSAEIGGSPRATGTSLSAQQIADAVAQAYDRPTIARRLAALGMALMESGAVMAGSMFISWLQGLLRNPAAPIKSHFQNQSISYAAVLSVLTAGLLLAASRNGRKLVGLCMPAGVSWLALIPSALLGGLTGGAWILMAPDTAIADYVKYSWVKLAATAAFPMVAEVLFRGIVHGRLAQHFRTQHLGSPWFLSWPVIFSSMVYALWSSLPFLPFYSAGMGITFASALIFGISSGMVRERSESLLPCIILHWSCVMIFVVWKSVGYLAF
ncbi:MAG: lysostaphin resistance A-like protein [Alphaproteobacteria bacterium]